MLAECFEVLGGVPKVVLADRMGCLKGGVVANRVVPTSRLRPVRDALPVPAGLLRGRGPGVQGHRRGARRVRQGRLPAARCCSSSRRPERGVPGRWCWATCTARTSSAAGVVRGGQRGGAQRGRCGPGRAAGHRAGAAHRRCRRCGPRSGRRRSCARSTSWARSGSGRPATPSRPRSSGPAWRWRSTGAGDSSSMRAPGSCTPNTRSSVPGRPPSWTSTTADRGPRRAGRSDRKPLRRNSSARSGRPRRRSSPAPPRPGTPASGRSWPS